MNSLIYNPTTKHNHQKYLNLHCLSCTQKKNLKERKYTAYTLISWPVIYQWHEQIQLWTFQIWCQILKRIIFGVFTFGFKNFISQNSQQPQEQKLIWSFTNSLRKFSSAKFTFGAKFKIIKILCILIFCKMTKITREFINYKTLYYKALFKQMGTWGRPRKRKFQLW